VKAKNMEREINEFRAKRERELQEQALEMRQRIVAEITSMVVRKTPDPSSIIIDSSGMGLNGARILLYARQVPIISDEIVAALNQSTATEESGAASIGPLVSSAALRWGCVDIDRAFKALPESKQVEAEMADQKAKADTEMATAEAKARETKQKELEALAAKKRESIMQKITESTHRVAEAAGFNLVFDASGNTLNAVPLLVVTSDLPDLTDEVVSAVSTEAK
jgi:Skp family chaperone for outer membrane proteins